MFSSFVYAKTFPNTPEGAVSHYFYCLKNNDFSTAYSIIHPKSKYKTDLYTSLCMFEMVEKNSSDKEIYGKLKFVKTLPVKGKGDQKVVFTEKDGSSGCRGYLVIKDGESWKIDPFPTFSYSKEVLQKDTFVER
jgi:hypothetical protein